MKHASCAGIVALALFAALTLSPVRASDKAQEVVVPPGAITLPGGFGAFGGEQEGPFQDFNQVIKDMVKLEGLMTLYRYKPDDPTKDQTKLLAQIPKKLLKQDLLLATSISRGGMSGFQWNDYLVRFEAAGPQGDRRRCPTCGSSRRRTSP